MLKRPCNRPGGTGSGSSLRRPRRTKLGSHELTQVLELNERMLDDLKHRELAVQEKEDEARRALDQVLARCVSEHAAIAQEKVVLAQAEELYRRFLGGRTQESVAVDPQSPEPETPQPPKWSQQPAMVDAPHGQQTLVKAPSSLVEWAETASASGRNSANRVGDLRSEIRGQVSGKGDPKDGTWATPLRGVFGSNA